MPHHDPSDAAATGDLARQVFGQRAAYYVTSATHTDPRVLARVVELAAPRPSDLALDIGTGTGHTALALAPHLSAIWGLDLTPEMLSQAESLRAGRGAANVAWLLGDVHSLPVAAGSLDIVACRRAAHHFADMHGSLAEVRRVLKPGGRLVIDDRSAPEDPALDTLLNELDRLHDHSHVREYPPTQWAALLERAGFVVDAIEPYTQHRPISSLTEDVAPEDVARIYALVEGMSPEQAAELHLERQEDTWYFDHHYLLAAAHVAP
jgi:SAM-dependent methyltransferase